MRLFTIPLLQRYILYELLKVFTFLLSILTILLVFVGVFREATMSGLGPIQALRILPYVVPNLLPFTIPATLLLTVSVVYGRMSGDQEITAAKAAGINVLSLLWPSFLLGAVLSVWAVMAGTMDDMLLAHNVADERTSMFYRFIADAVIWFMIVLLGYNVPGLLRRLFQGPSSDGEHLLKVNVGEAKGKRAPSRTGKDLLANPVVNGLLGAAGICVVALILLKILVRSGKTQVGAGALMEVALPPETGQIILAVFLSFYVGVRLVLWLFDSPCWGLLLGPGLVAVIGYFLAANNRLPQEVIDQAPHFVRSSVSYTLMAPVHLVGIGTLAVISSYWAVQLQKHKPDNDTAQAT